MAKRLQIRRDTEANWASVNPTLLQGEIGYVLDGAGNVIGQKVGNGVTSWRDLPFFTASDNSITEAKLSAEVRKKLNEPEIKNAEVSVSNTTGAPSATAQVVGDTLKLQFNGIKGERGETANMRIEGYVDTVAQLPTGMAIGTAYCVKDSTYTEVNPKYRVYVYTSNGWVDNGLFGGISAGVVQETGDSENVVMSQKAVSKKMTDIGAVISDVALRIGEDSVLLAGGQSVAHLYPLEKGMKCKVKNVGTMACSVQLRDENKEVVQNIGDLDINSEKSFVVNVDNAVYVGGYCYEGYNVEFTAERGNSMNARLSAVDDRIEILWQSALYTDFISIKLTLKNNSLIAPSGVYTTLTSGAEALHVSEPIAVKEYEKLEIYGSSQYGNCYYAIYDNDGNVVAKEEGEQSITSKKFSITAPSGSSFIRVSWLGGTPSPYINISRIAEHGKTWAGIKWVCFGDSLTEGSNGTAAMRYYDYIAQEMGITPLDYGKSGTGYFKNYGTSKNFLTRIEELADVDFDVITFFGSFNDLDGGWVGGSTDSTDTSSNNVCGFINATLNRLYEIKPYVKVGIITPTPWYNSKTLTECSQYSDALVDIARKRSIPCLDLFRCSNLHPDKENFRKEFYSENGVQDNGTHPNSKGHKRIYPQFREFLKTML